MTRGLLKRVRCGTEKLPGYREQLRQVPEAASFAARKRILKEGTLMGSQLTR